MLRYRRTGRAWGPQSTQAAPRVEDHGSPRRLMIGETMRHPAVDASGRPTTTPQDADAGHRESL